MNENTRVICKRYAEAFFLEIEEDDFEECFKNFEAFSLEVERLYRRKNGIKGITVRSALPLHNEERIQLREVLTRKFGRVEIREIVDKAVVGGLVIHFGDQVIDDSLRSRIKQLRELMFRVDAEWLMTLINQPSVAL